MFVQEHCATHPYGCCMPPERTKIGATLTKEEIRQCESEAVGAYAYSIREDTPNEIDVSFSLVMKKWKDATFHILNHTKEYRGSYYSTSFELFRQYYGEYRYVVRQRRIGQYDFKEIFFSTKRKTLNFYELASCVLEVYEEVVKKFGDTSLVTFDP
jgi:hypothetical protein